MKSKLIKVLPYICGALIGFVGGFIGIGLNINLDLNWIYLIPIMILQMIVFVVAHELSHGFVADKNGLKFTVLYLGPFTFRRENNKFKKIKSFGKQLTYVGRAQIDNFEILNEEDVEKARKAWIKALKAGPLSDLILGTTTICIGLIFKWNLLIISTVIIFVLISIPSYIMGDGKHMKLIKKNKIFTDVILYTYSIVGNTPISRESISFLLQKIENNIEKTNVNKDNLISLALSAQSLYMDAICNNKEDLSPNINEIVEVTIENKNIFLNKQIESSYYKGLINIAIMYEAIIKNNKERALELYKHVKKEKHNMPGEKLDFYRVEHTLGIANRKGEISNENLMNPIFKGCEGVESMERIINELILEKSKIIYT